MRKHLLLVLVIFFLAACGFSPDKAEVKTLINQALNIDCPDDFTILKSYNARAMDDYLEAVVIEFSKEGFAALKNQIKLTQWKQNNNEYVYSTKLPDRYSATLTINADNHKLRYERLHK
ncbi:hypothetical protein ACFL3U_05195 [Pseudomonadota bacterium]